MLIRVKDKEYELRFTINVLCLMADEGYDVLNMDKMLENVNIATIRTLFYYGLKGADKKITINRAGEIIEEMIETGEYTLFDIIELVMNALAKSLGGKKEEAEVEEEGLK